MSNSTPGTAATDPGVDLEARDAARWARVALQYPKAPPGLINLEHGYFGAMALPVQTAYEDGIRHVNHAQRQRIDANPDRSIWRA